MEKLQPNTIYRVIALYKLKTKGDKNRYLIMLEDLTIVLSSYYAEQQLQIRYPEAQKGEIIKEKFKIATTKLNTTNPAHIAYMDCKIKLN